MLAVSLLLKHLPYLSRCPHYGGFHALHECARFGDNDLWACGEAHFTQHGALLPTVEALTARSTAGWCADGFDARLSVGPIAALSRLINHGCLVRVEMGGYALLCAPVVAKRQLQEAARLVVEASPHPVLPSRTPFRLAAAFVPLSGVFREAASRCQAGHPDSS